jgi:hypothetical protein
MVEALSVTSYLPSSSSEINLTVGIPVASIVSCTFPSSPQKAGTSLKVSFTIINNGVYGTIYYSLRDNRTLEEFGTSTAVLAPGEQRSWDVYITMPSRDITLQLSAGHIVDSSYYMDDYRQQDILLLIEVLTALTLSLNKTTASPGETLTATGTLTRTDTGSGLGGQTVYLLVDGSTVKNTTTASDGSYSMSFSAPTSTGAHKVKAEFRGATASAILSVEYVRNYAIPISILVLGVALSTYIPKIKSR